MFKCILTGLGNRGLFWLGEVNRHPRCEAVGFVEPGEAQRARAIERGVRGDMIFSSLDEAVRKVKADFVLDVTPPHVHHHVAATAFAAGLHVLGEKPLSDDYTIARKIAGAGAKSGLKHMIAQNYRFDVGARGMRKLIADNAVGEAGQLDVQFYKAWADVPGSHYVTQPFMLINDMMVHHFDLMRFLLGVDPVAVQAVTWNHKWGWHAGDAAHSIVFEFPGGVWATHVSIACSVGDTRRDYYGDWRVDGPDGSLFWSEGRIHRAKMHRTDRKVREELFPAPAPSGGAGIFDEFFAAITENRQPECNAEDNLRSVAMVFAAIRSAKEKRRVELSELQ